VLTSLQALHALGRVARLERSAVDGALEGELQLGSGVVGAGERELDVGVTGVVNRVVSGGVVSATDVQLWLAGVGSTLPSNVEFGSTGSALSLARTSKVCSPGAKSGNSSRRLNGLMHSNQSVSSVLSSRHSKVSARGWVWSSVPVNSKTVSLVPLAGATVIVVFGGVVSSLGVTVHS
jgi:hypothetical protein